MKRKKTKRQQRPDPGRRRLTDRSFTALEFIERLQPISTAALADRMRLSAPIARRELRKLNAFSAVHVHLPRGMEGANYYTLSAAGRRFLAARHGVDPATIRIKRGIRTVELDHHDGVVALVVAVELAAEAHRQLAVREVLLERDIRVKLGGEVDRGALLPDVVVALDHGRGELLALAGEIDLGTESPSYFASTKGAGYTELHRARQPMLGCAKWVVLVIVPNRRRVHTLVNALLDVPGAERTFFFGLADELAGSSVLGPMWQRIEVSADGETARIVRTRLPVQAGTTGRSDRRYNRRTALPPRSSRYSKELGHHE